MSAEIPRDFSNAEHLNLLKATRSKIETQIKELEASLPAIQLQIRKLQAHIKVIDESISTYNNEANSNGDQAQN